MAGKANLKKIFCVWLCEDYGSERCPRERSLSSDATRIVFVGLRVAGKPFIPTRRFSDLETEVNPYVPRVVDTTSQDVGEACIIGCIDDHMIGLEIPDTVPEEFVSETLAPSL